jgi:RNA polymerase sigma factor (sigma-70 family)
MARERVGSPEATALLPMVDTDVPYVLRIKAGETDAFGPLWEKYERALYQFFLKQTGDRQDAEDLASETLIAALQSIPDFRGAILGNGKRVQEKNCSFKTYLTAVARYKLAGWIRRKRVRNEVRFDDCTTPREHLTEGQVALESSNDVPLSDPLQTVLAAERSDYACYALANIGSSAQFKVVALHYFVGLTHQDIATVLTTPSQVVNTRLQDGRKALRREISSLEQAITEA